jgi:hypothetical protein
MNRKIKIFSGVAGLLTIAGVGVGVTTVYNGSNTGDNTVVNEHSALEGESVENRAVFVFVDKNAAKAAEVAVSRAGIPYLVTASGELGVSEKDKEAALKVFKERYAEGDIRFNSPPKTEIKKVKGDLVDPVNTLTGPGVPVIGKPTPLPAKDNPGKGLSFATQNPKPEPKKPTLPPPMPLPTGATTAPVSNPFKDVKLPSSKVNPNVIVDTTDGIWQGTRPNFAQFEQVQTRWKASGITAYKFDGILTSVTEEGLGGYFIDDRGNRLSKYLPAGTTINATYQRRIGQDVRAAGGELTVATVKMMKFQIAPVNKPSPDIKDLKGISDALKSRLVNVIKGTPVDYLGPALSDNEIEGLAKSVAEASGAESVLAIAN